MRTESVTNSTENGTDPTNNKGEKEVKAKQDRSVGTACTAKITNNGADTAIATPHLCYMYLLLQTPPASPSPELKLQQLLRRVDHLPPHNSFQNSLHPPTHLPLNISAISQKYEYAEQNMKSSIPGFSSTFFHFPCFASRDTVLSNACTSGRGDACLTAVAPVRQRG